MLIHIYTWYTCSSKKETMIIPGYSKQVADEMFQAWVDKGDNTPGAWTTQSYSVDLGKQPMLLCTFVHNKLLHYADL